VWIPAPQALSGTSKAEYASVILLEDLLGMEIPALVTQPVDSLPLVISAFATQLEDSLLMAMYASVTQPVDS